MKSLATRAFAAALVAVAALSAACSNDPTGPKAPSSTRTPSASPSHYVGSAPVSGAVGGETGGATTNSGYMITWNRDGQPQPQGQ